MHVTIPDPVVSGALMMGADVGTVAAFGIAVVGEGFAIMMLSDEGVFRKGLAYELLVFVSAGLIADDTRAASCTPKNHLQRGDTHA